MKTAANSPRRRRLATKVIGLTLAGSMSVFIAVFSFNSLSWRRVISRNLEAEAAHLTLSHANKIQTVLHGAEKTPRYLARMLELAMPDEAGLFAMLEEAVTVNPEAAAAGVFFEPGGFDGESKYFGRFCHREGDGVKRLALGCEDYHYFIFDWYLIPKVLGKPVWSEPYYDEGGANIVMTTYTVPIHAETDGRMLGVVTTDLGLDWLAEMVSSISVLKSGFAFIISQNGLFVTHPDRELIMRQSIFDLAEAAGDLSLRQVGRDMIAGKEGLARVKTLSGGRDAWLYYAPLASPGWSMGVIFPEDELMAGVRAMDRRLLLIGLMGFGALLAMSIGLSRHLARPIHGVIDLASRIGDGDLGETMARLPAFEEKANAMTTLEYSKLMQAFVGMARTLNSLIGQVQRSGIQVTSSATEISASARQLEATVAEQAASTEQVAATSREISRRSGELMSTMGDVSGIARENAVTAGNCRESLDSMGTVMNSLVDATEAISDKLSAISQKAGRIGSVVTTISKVADQTNLLSLNAAIEAEKAGESGRGFSVVAREIRRLADQTAEATTDIEEMVKEMHSSVSSGVMEMDKFIRQVRQGSEDIAAIGNRLSGMIDQAQALFPRFESVSASMEEQSAGAGEISDAMVQLSSTADQTRESLGEFRKATGQLTEAVQGLREEIARFRVNSSTTGM